MSRSASSWRYVGSALSAGSRSAAGALARPRQRLGGGDLALQALNLGVLLRVHRRRLVELPAKRDDPLLRASWLRRPSTAAPPRPPRFIASICRSSIASRSCSLRSDIGRVLLLLAESADHLQVGLRLLGKAAHVGLLHLAQPLLDGLEAIAALTELRGQERRRVLGAGLAQLGVLVDERRGAAGW